MRIVQYYIWIQVIGFGLAYGVADANELAQGPVASKKGADVEIAFRTAEATDVEVAILDAEGRVVRHLVAGQLNGPKPPPRPLRPGLEQTVVWDGLNDDGQPATGGPFRARVRTGLRPVFDRFIADTPENQGSPHALGCDMEGRLLVLSRWSAPNGHYPGAEIKRFNRDGSYLNQVVPFRSDLPADRLAGVEQITPADGGKPVPIVYHGGNHSVMPMFGGVRQQLLTRPDGKLLIVNSTMGDSPVGFRSNQRRILVLEPDGGIGKDYSGPLVAGSECGGGGYITPALSPDGKTIYLSGYRRRGEPVPVVTRTVWGAEGEPEIFLGEPDKPGAEPAGLIEPRGLATDSDGRLYVCDNAAGRVAIFAPDNKLAGQIPVKHPDMVAVHRRTGAVYVLTVRPDPKRNRGSKWSQGHNWSQGKRLLKFDSCEATKPSATLDFPTSPVKTLFALDDAGEETALWIGPVAWGNRNIMRVTDQGTAFSEPSYPIRDRVPESALATGYVAITVDPHTEEVWVSRQEAHNWQGSPSARRFDGRSGEFLGRVTLDRKITRPAWGEIEFAYDGRTVLHQTPYSEMPVRFDREGRPAPWPGGEKDQPAVQGEKTQLAQGFMHPRGLTPARDGGFYVAHHRTHRSFNNGRVSRVGPDGAIAEENLVQVDVPIGGVRVGREGHIYVGVHLKPAKQFLPDWFSIFPGGHLLPVPEPPANWGSEPGQIPPEPASWYVEQYGSVVKFKPQGGCLRFRNAGPWFAPNLGGERGGWSPTWRTGKGSVSADGKVWLWYGLAPSPSRRGTSRSLGGPRCNCQTARFDLDLYDRLYAPDVFRFGVAVLDANGNLIGRFGQYGNVDDTADGTAIPLAWPHAVALSREAGYVADMVNRRIVRVRLGAATESLCDLP